MLTHAMAHVTQRNASAPLIFIGGSSGSCSEDSPIPLGLISAQKSKELEADAVAVGTMARAGLDPRALARYIERVQVRTADRDQRLAAMLSAIGKLPPAEYAAAPSDEFPVVQQEVRHLSEP